MNSFTCNATALPRSFRLTDRTAETLFNEMVEMSFFEPIFSNEKQIDLHLNLLFGTQDMCLLQEDWRGASGQFYVQIGLRSVVLQLELERCSVKPGSERAVSANVGGRFVTAPLPAKKWLVGEPGSGDLTEPSGPGSRCLYSGGYLLSDDMLCRIRPDEGASDCRATITMRAALKDVMFRRVSPWPDRDPLSSYKKFARIVKTSLKSLAPSSGRMRHATGAMYPSSEPDGCPLNRHKKFAQQVSEIGKFPGGATHEGFIDLARASATFSLEAPYLPQPTSPAGDLFE